MIILFATLAIFYITLLITNTDGPFELLEKLRDATREYRGLNLDCFFCTAFWTSLPFAVYFSHDFAQLLVYWFGLAGGAVIINEGLSDE